jgi:hypothetical protein
MGRTVRVVRRVVVVLASVVSVGAAVAAWQANAGDDDCATTMVYAGVSYSVVQVTDEVGGTELGVGRQRGCGARGHWSETVALSRIPGVDPGTAVATPVAADIVYVAQGVPVSELPGNLAELLAQ